jgi:hypothetical protein
MVLEIALMHKVGDIVCSDKIFKLSLGTASRVFFSFISWFDLYTDWSFAANIYFCTVTSSS